MEQAIVVPETQALAVTSPMGIDEIVAQVHLIQSVMSKVMVRDEHYGIVPGTGDKPTLLKPGAEKLSMTFKLAPQYEIKAVDMGNEHREYEVVCNLTAIQTGVFLGSGVGNCNTKESKYRYRSENTGKTVPSTYWKSRDTSLLGGSRFRAKKKDGKWVICEQVEHDNPADYYNTAKKMAKKRAFVDAVLTVTAASDIFTQDIEDMPNLKKEDPQKTKDTSPPADKINQIDQATRLVKLMNDDKTAKDLQKRYEDNLKLIASFPENLKKQIYGCYWTCKKTIEGQEATPPIPTPDSVNEEPVPQNEEEIPLSSDDDLPSDFGEGPELMSDAEKLRTEAGELMTSLSNTASEELGEVVANLKKGYLEKFPEDIQDEILAHCDRLLEAMEKGNGKQPENNPTKVKNLFRYLDQCKMDKAGALAQIKKDSFEGMSKSDQDQIIKYASK